MQDYIYAVAPLLEDALMDRDLVHRQTAAAVVQHISLGVAGLGCEDALVHLLNYVFPNIFEVSPHIIQTVSGAIDGCRVACGPAVILSYLLQVRELRFDSTQPRVLSAKLCTLMRCALSPYTRIQGSCACSPWIDVKEHAC